MTSSAPINAPLHCNGRVEHNAGCLEVMRRKKYTLDVSSLRLRRAKFEVGEKALGLVPQEILSAGGVPIFNSSLFMCYSLSSLLFSFSECPCAHGERVEASLDLVVQQGIDHLVALDHGHGGCLGRDWVHGQWVGDA
jgi:hypothetical protein